MKRNLIAKIACLLVGVATLGTPAGATPLYFNDFESNSTANFSGTTTLTTAPSNVTKFLGPLSAGQTATLTLNGVIPNRVTRDPSATLRPVCNARPDV